MEAERIAYEIQINQLQTNVGDLERELESLNRENKELRRIGAQRLRELEEFKRRVKDMDEQHRIQVDEVKRELSSKLSKQSSVSDYSYHKAKLLYRNLIYWLKLGLPTRVTSRPYNKSIENTRNKLRNFNN